MPRLPGDAAREAAHGEVLARLDALHHLVGHLDGRLQDLEAVVRDVRELDTDHVIPGLAAIRTTADDVVPALARVHADLIARQVDSQAHLEAAQTQLHAAGAALAGLAVSEGLTRAEVLAVRVALLRLSSSLAGIVEVQEKHAPQAVPAGPLVTLVVPTHKRPQLLLMALGSIRAQTYEHWEAVVVNTSGPLPDLPEDERIRVVEGPGRGCAPARALGIRHARGELVGFLDDDNTMTPQHLASVVETMAEPGVMWTVSGQLAVDVGTGLHFVRDDRCTPERLREANHFDANVITVRRELLERVGGGGGHLHRLDDWDLALRLLAAAGMPARTGRITSVYRASGDDRVTTGGAPYWPEWAQIRQQRVLPGRAEGLRVLAVTGNHPQATETDVVAHLRGLERLGAHVEMWSEHPDVKFLYDSTFSLHSGDLASVLAEVRPDVVVAFWLNTAVEHVAVVGEAGVPMIALEHGFDWSPERVDALLAWPEVLVGLNPQHLDPALPPGRTEVVRTPFDSALFQPSSDKDRSLVVRTGPALLEKDYDLFFDVARRCPELRFVLAIWHCHEAQDDVDEIVRRHQESGAPVELLVDVPHAEAAQLVSRAGIYLHTWQGDVFGQPISIVEAMATGCHVLVGDHPGAQELLGPAGAVYADAVQAAGVLDATLRWADADWHRAWAAGVERAWEHHVDTEVAARLITAAQAKVPTLGWRR